MPDSKKELSPSKVLLFGTIIKNPILVQVIGLCPAVAASSSLTVALLLSFVTTVLLIICEVFASAVLKPLSSWFRVAVYMIMGLLFICPLMYILDEAGFAVVNNAGIYLPLMAANSVVALRCEKFAVKRNAFLSFYDALATGVGVSAVLILSGFVRELLGSGTVAGRAVFDFAPLPALTMPFGGFVVLGFSAAILKWFISAFLSEYSHDMPFKIKKAQKRRPQRVEEKAARPVLTAEKAVTPAAIKAEASDTAKAVIPDIPKGRESFADVLYNSMSADMFTAEDSFDDILAGISAESGGADNPPVTREDFSVSTDGNGDAPREEAERVIIPVDLDLVEEQEISRAIASGDEGGSAD
jgi:Na+-translocating ferredoxin:NAD+ oxidoreductase RnfE subunit